MQQDLFVPLMFSVEEVLKYLRHELPHQSYDHGLIIDQFLSDLFMGYQYRYKTHHGPKACFARDGVTFFKSEEQIDHVLNNASTILNHLVATFWPDFTPAPLPIISDDQRTVYSYNGGTDLLIYMPYVEAKHAHIPRNILVPRSAVANSSFRCQI